LRAERLDHEVSVLVERVTLCRLRTGKRQETTIGVYLLRVAKMVSAITALSLFLSNMVTLLLWLGVLISERPGVGTGGKPHNWVAPD
jgi:hypothetical protein